MAQAYTMQRYSNGMKEVTSGGMIKHYIKRCCYPKFMLVDRKDVHGRKGFRFDRYVDACNIDVLRPICGWALRRTGALKIPCVDA